MNEENGTFIKVEELTKFFPITKGVFFRKQVGAIKAVDNISFEIAKGETLGLVGESGCGKTTVGRTILHLYSPTKGKVFYKGKDLGRLNHEQLRRLRQHLQIIFQDPYASLNPRMNIGRIVSEPLVIHNVGTKRERQERAKELLSIVGLNPYFITRYPHEFSGGQRQRIGVARALALNPEFIVCDEPISALDVSIQAQIINLLQELQEHFMLTYLFIAHDLSMVRHLSDRIAVMYLGKIVELAERDELFKRPAHPYTKALLSAVPIPDPMKESKRVPIILSGDVPSPANPPKGCRFHTRCPVGMDICREEPPIWKEISSKHWVECHLEQKL